MLKLLPKSHPLVLKAEESPSKQLEEIWLHISPYRKWLAISWCKHFRMPSHWNASSCLMSRVLGQSRKISCPMPWGRTKSLQVECLKTTTDGCSKSCQRQVLHWPKQKQKTQHWIWEWEVPRNGICFTECHQVLELTWYGEDTHEPDEQSASSTWRQKYAFGTHIFAVPCGSWMKIPEKCNQIQCCQNLLQDYTYLWYWYSKRNLGAFVLEVRLQSASIDFNIQWFNNYYSRLLLFEFQTIPVLQSS